MTDATEPAPRTMPSDMPPAVVVGASAGGVTALQRLVADLPHDLPAAVLVVLHLNPSGVSMLPEILGRAGSLPTAAAVDGEPLRAATIRVAPPDRHLHVADGRLVVDRGPREHGHRPAIDRLFRAVARSHGSTAVGVLLSGMLDDGVRGLDEIHRAGGTTIAQDPTEARFPALPTAAIDAGAVDLVLSVDEMAAEIERLVRSATRRSRQLRRAEVAERRADVLHDLLTHADTDTGEQVDTDQNRDHNRDHVDSEAGPNGRTLDAADVETS